MTTSLSIEPKALLCKRFKLKESVTTITTKKMKMKKFRGKMQNMDMCDKSAFAVDIPDERRDSDVFLKGLRPTSGLPGLDDQRDCFVVDLLHHDSG